MKNIFVFALATLSLVACSNSEEAAVEETVVDTTLVEETVVEDSLVVEEVEVEGEMATEE
jgi:uncharacterized protein YcfL